MQKAEASLPIRLQASAREFRPKWFAAHTQNTTNNGLGLSYEASFCTSEIEIVNIEETHRLPSSEFQCCNAESVLEWRSVVTDKIWTVWINGPQEVTDA
jgi:hypothetical protein